MQSKLNHRDHKSKSDLIAENILAELCDINIQRTVEAQGGREGGDDLCQETVEIGVCWTLNVEVAPADIIQSFIVVHDLARSDPPRLDATI